MTPDEFEMVMPFITTTDNGGIHEPASYVAGFEMGHLDAVLGMTSHLDVLPGPVTIHAENQPQADLLAMKHGYRSDFTEIEGFDGWVVCGFARVDAEPPDPEDEP